MILSHHGTFILWKATSLLNHYTISLALKDKLKEHFFKSLSKVYWVILLISALWKQRQANLHEFETNLNYKARVGHIWLYSKTLSQENIGWSWVSGVVLLLHGCVLCPSFDFLNFSLKAGARCLCRHIWSNKHMSADMFPHCAFPSYWMLPA